MESYLSTASFYSSEYCREPSGAPALPDTDTRLQVLQDDGRTNGARMDLHSLAHPRPMGARIHSLAEA